MKTAATFAVLLGIIVQTENKISSRGFIVCNEEKTVFNGVTFTWKEALIGIKRAAKPDCYYPNMAKKVSRTCKVKLFEEATFEELKQECQTIPDVEDCKDCVDDATIDFEDLLNGDLTANEITDGLLEILKNTSSLEPHDLLNAAYVLEKLSNLNDTFEVQHFVDCIDKLMLVDKSVLVESQKYFNASNLILENIDNAMRNLIRLDIREFSAASQNFLVHASPVKHQDITGIAFYKNNKIIALTDKDKVDNINQNDLIYAAFFSEDFKENLLDQSVIVSSLFQNYALFVIENSTSDSTDKIVSSIFSTDAKNLLLKAPLTIAYKTNFDASKQHVCTHWKYTESSWFTDVAAYTSNNNKMLLCDYNHMTHFSVILNLPTDHALNIVSLIGTTLSLICMVAIYMTAVISRSWRETDSAKISLSSCATIVVQLVFLLVADSVNPNRNFTLCFVISLILHYSIVSQFCWMLILGVLQYRKFVVVFTGTHQRTFLICSLFAWITPLLPISFTLGFFDDCYTNNDFCYLTGAGLYWGVVFPVTFTIFVNVAIFGRIFYEFSNRKKTGCFGLKQKQYHLYVKLSVYLFFLLGFTWIFGLLNGFIQHIALSYVFSICASFQGVVLFWYHIILNNDARKAWIKTIGRITNIKINDISITTVNKSGA